MKRMKLNLAILAIVVASASAFTTSAKKFATGFFRYTPNHSYSTFANTSTNFFKDADLYIDRTSPLNVDDADAVCDGITTYVCAVQWNSGADNNLTDADLASVSAPSSGSALIKYRSTAN